MALAFQREQVGVKVTTTPVTVPDDPKAKLMYYLDCIATVLELDDLPSELRNYRNYHSLNGDKTEILLKFCLLLNPDLLDGKCIFEASDLPNYSNEFLELSSTRTTMVAASGVMIGGRNVRVAKIMLYLPSWRRNNFDEPLAAMTRRLAARQASRQAPRPAITSGRRERSEGCVIL